MRKLPSVARLVACGLHPSWGPLLEGAARLSLRGLHAPGRCRGSTRGRRLPDQTPRTSDRHVAWVDKLERAAVALSEQCNKDTYLSVQSALETEVKRQVQAELDVQKNILETLADEEKKVAKGYNPAVDAGKAIAGIHQGPGEAGSDRNPTARQGPRRRRHGGGQEPRGEGSERARPLRKPVRDVL